MKFKETEEGMAVKVTRYVEEDGYMLIEDMHKVLKEWNRKYRNGDIMEEMHIGNKNETHVSKSKHVGPVEMPCPK